MDLTKQFFDKFPDKMKEELKEFYEDLSEQEFDSKYATIMQCRRRWVLPRPIELIRFQDLFDIKLFAKMMRESLSQRGLQKEEDIDFITLPSLLKRGIKVIGNAHELESVEE